MRNRDTHITDRELIQAADGELNSRRAAEVREHLAACWTCRTRMGEIEGAIAGFVHAHQTELPLPPADGPRAMLRARLAEAAAGPLTLRERFSAFMLTGNRLAWVGGVMLAITLGLYATALLTTADQRAGLRPDPGLTPGEIRTVTEAELCAEEPEQPRIVPASLGQEVFERYGIEPRPRAYEVDYLIAPELGGAVDDVRNFWPQPYNAPIWTAHVKDALEDYLHQQVCEQKVDLKTAQQEIARDWISAYKKYFHTQKPMANHVRFTKDQPWE